MLETLESLHGEALAALDAITTSEALREWEIKYLGKKGAITEIMRGVGGLPKEERADFGKRANEIKAALTTAFAERETLVRQQELAQDLE
ncbi:MAG: phenylalanine--tRNA ligase subunit alpha, partial [Chloroflexota bacterium]